MSYSKFILVFLLFIILLNLATSNNLFKVNETWEKFVFSIDGKDQSYKNCTPFKMKISPNGTTCFSFPRIYNQDGFNVTFAVLKKFGDELYFETWPSDEMNLPKYNRDENNKLFSVTGFEISENDTYYLLDQGRIFSNNNTVKPGTSKLMVVNSNRQILKIYNFGNGSDFENSFFTDLVIDFNNNFAYITDSGIYFNNSENNPSIIILNLNNGKIYRILKNNKIFKSDEALSLMNNGKIINESLYRGVGLNNIALTCDGENILFSTMKNRMIYSLSTKDIINAIKKNENDLDINENFDIKIGYKDKMGDGFIISSKNSLYMTNIEDNNIKYSINIDNDLMRFDFNDFSTLEAERKILWPSLMDIFNGTLYLLDSHYNTFLDENYSQIIKDDNSTNDTINYTIYIYSLGTDEYSRIRGCTNFFVDWNIISIIVLIWFGIILIIVIIFIVISMKEDKKLKEEAESKEVRLSNTRESAL